MNCEMCENNRVNREATIEWEDREYLCEFHYKLYRENWTIPRETYWRWLVNQVCQRTDHIRADYTHGKSYITLENGTFTITRASRKGEAKSRIISVREYFSSREPLPLNDRRVVSSLFRHLDPELNDLYEAWFAHIRNNIMGLRDGGIEGMYRDTPITLNEYTGEHNPVTDNEDWRQQWR